MGMTGIRAFDSSLVKTKEWLKDILSELKLEDEEQAYAAFRSVSHALRDRLTVAETVDLSSQLPMLLAGVFYEGWKPEGKPLKIHSKRDFFDLVESELLGRMDPELAVRAVFKVYDKRINKGEISQVKSGLPSELRSLWPEPECVPRQ
jgi:uncharacterized protein (DUF2267 family)